MNNNNFKLVLRRIGNTYYKVRLDELEEGDYFRAYDKGNLESIIRNNHVYQKGIVDDIELIKEYMKELGNNSILISIHDDMIEETNADNIPLGSKFYISTKPIKEILAPTQEQGFVIEKFNKITGNVIYDKEGE